MHIIIDGRMINPYIGIGKYTMGLIQGIDQFYTEEIELTVLYMEEQQKFLRNDRISWIQVGTKPFSLKEQWVIPQTIKNINYDVFHSPFFSSPFFIRKPLITIHDLIHVKFRSEFGLIKYWYYTYYVKSLLKKSKIVITDSLSSQRDIKAFFNIRDLEVYPVYLCNLTQPQRNNNSHEFVKLITENYFIFVGNSKAYKNVSLAIESVQLLNKQLDENYKLVLVGDFDSIKGEDIIRFSSITSEELYSLYNHAIALVYPSLYEGFGLPLLEAMSVGLPVIASNRSSIPEVVGSAGLIIEPTVTEFTKAMRLTVEDSNFRMELSKKGLQRYQMFSLKQFIDQTVEVYKKMI